MFKSLKLQTIKFYKNIFYICKMKLKKSRTYKMSRSNIQKYKNLKTKKMKKTECILGNINKNGLPKNNINDFANDFNCLILGHKPCLLDISAEYYKNKIPNSIKINLQKLNTKQYKDVIYIYPRFRKQAILCNEIANNYNFFRHNLELEGPTKLYKRNYILGVLLGYRNNEIRGFFIRIIALNKVQYKKTLNNKSEIYILDKLIEEEIKKINISEFNINYKELKTICDKWIKMALGKNSIYNDLYEKANMDIKLLEV